MSEETLIKLNPYLANSKNLMEIFAIIGYEEKIIEEHIQDILENPQNFKISLLSIIKSDVSSFKFNPDYAINQVYPDNPKIIKIIKNKKQIPKSSSVLFYSCINSIDGKNKIIYCCYALRFYEKFSINSSEMNYYVPKAFLILSQYPYFTTYYNICKNLFEIIINKKNSIPIEIIIYNLINNTPSPLVNDLNLNIFPNESKIFIKNLTGYPFVDYDLCKIFNIMPINEFIKIFVLSLLETKLLFFSSDLLELNIFMYILNVLNYPLIDSEYHWNINSIPLFKFESFTDDPISPTFRGVNALYDNDYDFSNFRNLFFIVDIENKKLKYINDDNDKDNYFQELNQLLKYIHHLLNDKKVKSYFLSDNLLILRNRLKKIKKDYDSYKDIKKSDSFFYINSNIIQINKQIQKAFYDFILNILTISYNDYQLDPNSINIKQIKNNINERENISEEEKNFLKYFKDSIKYNSYFDLFIKNFIVVDELKVPLLFTDEFVYLKMRDKQISEKIDFFKLIDEYYSLNSKIIEINLSDLDKKVKNFYSSKEITKLNNEKNNHYIKLDEKILNIFLSNKNFCKYLKIKEKEDIKMNKVEKGFLIHNIQNYKYFCSLLEPEYFIRSSIVYLFSIVFPLFPHERIIIFLKNLLNNNIDKIIYFQRYFIIILLKSIHKYYIVNKENGIFPDLTFDNIKVYFSLIKDYLLRNSIIPNEEIILYFQMVFCEDKKNINVINNIINDNDNKNEINNIINIKDDKKDISNIINNNDIIEDNIIKNKQDFVFKYLPNENYNENENINNNKNKSNDDFFDDNVKEDSYEILFSPSMTLQQMNSIYDDYYNICNFNIMDFDTNILNECIINIVNHIKYLKDKDMSNHLTNTMIVLKNLSININEYKKGIIQNN